MSWQVILMEIILDLDIPLSGDIRLIKRLYKTNDLKNFPGGLMFALQYLWRQEGNWIEVTRIDNYKHNQNMTGAHIHKFDNDFVEFREISFEEAEQYILELAEKIKKDIMLGGT